MNRTRWATSCLVLGMATLAAQASQLVISHSGTTVATINSFDNPSGTQSGLNLGNGKAIYTWSLFSSTLPTVYNGTSGLSLLAFRFSGTDGSGASSVYCPASYTANGLLYLGSDGNGYSNGAGPFGGTPSDPYSGKEAVQQTYASFARHSLILTDPTAQSPVALVPTCRGTGTGWGTQTTATLLKGGASVVSGWEGWWVTTGN